MEIHLTGVVCCNHTVGAMTEQYMSHRSLCAVRVTKLKAHGKSALLCR